MRFMKGVSRNRPSAPRYNCIWDVDIVLNMFRKQPLAEFLSLYDLTLRTVTLLALVSAQRGQSIHLLDTDDMTRTRDKFVFHLHDAFKQARPGCEHLDIVLAAYVHDIRICIVHTLSLYLERTRSLRTTSTLFISTVKPHGSVSKDTIGSVRCIIIPIDGDCALGFRCIEFTSCSMADEQFASLICSQ